MHLISLIWIWNFGFCIQSFMISNIQLYSSIVFEFILILSLWDALRVDGDKNANKLLLKVCLSWKFSKFHWVFYIVMLGMLQRSSNNIYYTNTEKNLNLSKLISIDLSSIYLNCLLVSPGG